MGNRGERAARKAPIERMCRGDGAALAPDRGRDIPPWGNAGIRCGTGHATDAVSIPVTSVTPATLFVLRLFWIKSRATENLDFPMTKLSATSRALLLHYTNHHHPFKAPQTLCDYSFFTQLKQPLIVNSCFTNQRPSQPGVGFQ